MGIETMLVAGSLAASAGAGVMGALGNIWSGKASKEMAEYKGAVGLINAKQARLQGQAISDAQRRKTSGLIGQQHALQGASGVDVGSGSPVDVRASSAALGELDALTILNNAETKALGFQQQRQLDLAAGEAGETAGYIGAATSLLGAAGSVSDKWLRYKTPYGGTLSPGAGEGLYA